MNRLSFTKKRLLLTFIVLCALFGAGFMSCSNLGDDEGPSPMLFMGANGALLFVQQGQGVVSGTFAAPSNVAHTAMPTFPTIASYAVTATNGSETKNTTAISSGAYYTFSLALPYGTWAITVSAKDVGGNVVFSQTKSVTLSAASPTATAEFNLSYTNSGATTGNIELTIEYPSIATGMTYSLGSGYNQGNNEAGGGHRH